VSTIIGIDVGKRFVKIIQLEKKLSLNDWFIFPTPYTKSKDLDIKELVNRITSYLPLTLLKKSLIGINIPPSLVKVIVIQLPKMSRKEMPVAVTAEAKRKIVPPPGPDSVFEYSILGEIVVKDIPRLEVLVVETMKGYVSAILDAFSALGDLHPVLIAPTCTTIANCFPHAFKLQQKNIAFVDIGYDSLDIVIVKKGKLNFYRTVKFGLENIISHISETNNLSLEEAEEIIKNMGVPQVEIDLKDRVKVAEEIMRQKYEASGKERKEKVTPLELRILWQANIERMIQEIRRTLVYYKEQSKGERVDELYFLGGGAKIKGLIDIVSKEIGGGCNVFDPFEKIEISLSDEKKKILDLKPLFVPALSTALTVPLVSKEREINFLPEELKKKEITIRKQIGVIFISALIFSFIFLGWINLLIINRIATSAVERLRIKLKQKREIFKTIKELEKEKASIESKMGSVLEAEKKKKNIAAILKEITFLLPSQVFLTQLTIDKSKPEVSTFSSSGEFPKTRTSFKIIEKEKEQPSSYRLKMEIACVADYEQAIELAYYCKGILEDSSFFTDVILSPPEVKKITPSMGGFKQIELTPVALRTFKIEANLNIPE